MKDEILRSSYTLDGQRVFLIYYARLQVYRLALRWRWLGSFQTLADACEGFEALEMSEGDPVALVVAIKKEITRQPRYLAANGGRRMARIHSLLDAAERRIAGQRPVSTGRKGSVVRWVSA